MSLSDYFHSLREQHSLTVKDAAARIGCDPEAWEAVEAGRSSIPSTKWPKLAVEMSADIKHLNLLQGEFEDELNQRAGFRRNLRLLCQAIRSIKMDDGEYTQHDLWLFYGRCEGILTYVDSKTQVRYERALSRVMRIFYEACPE